jgi:hypothetical protein
MISVPDLDMNPIRIPMDPHHFQDLYINLRYVKLFYFKVTLKDTVKFLNITFYFYVRLYFFIQV